jgi:hypothetical protein
MANKTFTDEEKEKVFAMAKNEHSGTPKKDLVILTRKERNLFLKIAGIPNRFEKKKEYA